MDAGAAAGASGSRGQDLQLNQWVHCQAGCVWQTTAQPFDRTVAFFCDFWSSVIAVEVDVCSSLGFRLPVSGSCCVLLLDAAASGVSRACPRRPPCTIPVHTVPDQRQGSRPIVIPVRAVRQHIPGSVPGRGRSGRCTVAPALRRPRPWHGHPPPTGCRQRR